MEEFDLKEFLKKAGKRIGAVALSVTAAAAILVNLANPKPQEIVYAEPPAVVTEIQEAEEETPPEEEKKEERRADWKTRLKLWLASLPNAVKLLVVLPLWGIGALLTGLGAALGDLMAPVWGFLVKWLIAFAVLFGIILLVMKVLHPEMSFKEILHKLAHRGRLLWIAGAGATLMLADTMLRLTVDGYEKWRNLGLFCAGLIAASLLAVLIARSFSRRGKTASAAA